MEKLELCISACTNLRDHMTSAVQPGDEVIVEGYLTNIDSLIECVRVLHGKWLEYQDIVSLRAERSLYRYEVSTTAHGRGRPSFKEQLLHLSSLSFSWSEIASLLGVSRMTVYRL